MAYTLVLGASLNEKRYSNLAIHRLLQAEIKVLAIGRNAGETNGVEIQSEKIYGLDIHTVSIYLNPSNQLSYYEYLLEIKPIRIIFNPGAENPELAKLAKAKGIETLNACTLVMLNLNTYF